MLDMQEGDVIVIDLGSGTHRFAVVGASDEPQKKVLLVMVTSKVEKRRRHADRGTLSTQESLVEVQPGEYQSKENAERCSLTKPTCFDCNNPNPMPVTYLLGHVRCDPISDDLLKKLKQGVRRSPAVDQDTKETFGLQ